METEITASQSLIKQQLIALEVMPHHLSASGTLQQDNMLYQIRHVSIILLDNPQLTSFNNQSEAEQLLHQFKLDKQTLSDLIQEGNWKTNPHVWDYDKKIEKLAELILDNKW